MVVERKLVKSENYHKHILQARHMGPDLLGFVDGMELSNFFVDVEAALSAGRRYIDNQEEEERKRVADAARKK